MITLRTLHKYASLAIGLLWLLQAITGIVLSISAFGDNAPAAAPTNAVLVSSVAALRRVEPQGHIWRVKRAPGAKDFQVLINLPGDHTDVALVNANGRVLDRRPLDYDYPAPGILETLRVFHNSLFSGDIGRYFLGISGFFLVTNIIVGLQLAWPGRGQWWRWLAPRKQRTRLMTLFVWHRAVGLWLTIPALLIIGAGAILAFDDPLAAMIGAEQPPPHVLLTQEHGSPTSPAQAIAAAQALFPQAAFYQINLPLNQRPYYVVRLRQPGEVRAANGTTNVYVTAYGDKVVRVYDALKAPAKTTFINALYPLHTGEIADAIGQSLAIAVGLWMVAMAVLGTLLWWTKRSMRRKPAKARQSSLARSVPVSVELSGK